MKDWRAPPLSGCHQKGLFRYPPEEEDNISGMDDKGCTLNGTPSRPDLMKDIEFSVHSQRQSKNTKEQKSTSLEGQQLPP